MPVSELRNKPVVTQNDLCELPVRLCAQRLTPGPGRAPARLDFESAPARSVADGAAGLPHGMPGAAIRR
ncbi:hypothetical protein GCM10018980_12800 [Streptomyces capoamus]|uniref:Uncharacterized protein n=1 Tax=Streptomyces capoamus TaxID=68183 RepID=A0A919EUH7_9ACTN|nr:hypothetical protein [Streptomyces capoamus]GGW14268.1 hypothetical protein GCM10010501_21650 [Streptomyces libani subsp. rufus]GHG39379.1 hypothetical protein GCM10018980_12800 [Streptomyces capoamus]